MHGRGNHKTKSQLTEWEIIFAIRDCQAINLQYLQRAHAAQYKKTTTHNPIKKWAEDLTSYLSKEDIQMAKKYMKRCSTSLIIREMHLETTVWYHLAPIRTPIIKKSTNKFWRGCGKKGAPLNCWWECKQVQPL